MSANEHKILKKTTIAATLHFLPPLTKFIEEIFP